MKNNLIFTGLAESSNENTEHVLRYFILQEPGVEWDIEFGNVHRFGKRRDGNPRPIVACFLFYKDLAMVKSKAYRLKNKPYGITEQFLAIIEVKRMKLYPVAKRFRLAGHMTKLVCDKLFCLTLQKLLLVPTAPACVGTSPWCRGEHYLGEWPIPTQFLV